MITTSLSAMLKVSKTAWFIGFLNRQGHKTMLLPTRYYDNYDEAWDRMKEIQPRYKHRLEVFKAW